MLEDSAFANIWQPLTWQTQPLRQGLFSETVKPGFFQGGYSCVQCCRLEEMPEDSAEDNLAAFDPALAEAARALRQHGFLQTTASAGGSDAPTLALSSSTGNLQARPSQDGVLMVCMVEWGSCRIGWGRPW